MPDIIFKGQYKRGKAISAQTHLIDDLETTQDILEGVEGEDGIEIDKLNPKNWKIRLTDPPTGGLPEGYTEKTLRIWTDEGLVEGKFLVKDYSVKIPPNSVNRRMVLQSDDSGKIGLQYVRLANDGF